MKVFVAVLALVAVAAAEEMNVISGAAPVAAVGQQRSGLEEPKVFSVLAAPSFASTAELEQEKFGFKALYDTPFFMVAKNVENNKIEAYLLKNGFRSLYTPEFGFLRNQIMSGNKAGFMLSAVRYLDMPELLLPLEGVKFPQEINLFNLFSSYRKSPLAAPVMMIADKDALRSFSLEKLNEIGAFSMLVDTVKIFKDYSRTAPIASQQKYSLIQDEAAEYPFSVYPTAGVRAAYPTAYPAAYPAAFPAAATRRIPSYISRSAYPAIASAYQGAETLDEEAEIPLYHRRIPAAFPATATRRIPSYSSRSAYPAIASAYQGAETLDEEAEIPPYPRRIPVTKSSPSIVYIA